MKISFLFLLTLCLSSCYTYRNSNLYYLNLQKTTTEKYKPTKQLSSYDYNENNLNYFKQQGYIIIGYDAIRNTYIDYQEAINTGCWIGATIMLYKHQYVGTASGTAVVPFYNSGDTYIFNSTTSGSVNAYGSSNASVYGSDGYAYGNSYSSGNGTYNSNTTTTITTPGSFSYYSVPYSNDYYDQWAIYLVKPEASSQTTRLPKPRKVYLVKSEALSQTKVKSNSMYEASITIDLFKDASSEDGNAIMKVYPRTPFKILKKYKKFIKIEYQGKVGYILSGAPIKAID